LHGVCICVCVCMCMYACVYVCMYVCMYMCMYVCMCVCICVCMHACMYVCMYIGMYICMHACMCVCMYVCVQELHLIKMMCQVFGVFVRRAHHCARSRKDRRVCMRMRSIWQSKCSADFEAFFTPIIPDRPCEAILRTGGAVSASCVPSFQT
jgi:hypothetical protein